MNQIKKSFVGGLVFLVAVVFLFQSVQVVKADEAGRKKRFAQKHPRRAEVNGRIRAQNKRITQGVKNGKLTPEQAQELRADEAAIKKEERSEVKANGGYLTKEQKKDLNQKLNEQSKEIFKAKHPGAAPAQGQ